MSPETRVPVGKAGGNADRTCGGGGSRFSQVGKTGRYGSETQDMSSSISGRQGPEGCPGCGEDTRFGGVRVQGLFHEMGSSKLTKVRGLREAGLFSFLRVSNLEGKLESAHNGLQGEVTQQLAPLSSGQRHPDEDHRRRK